MYYDETPENEKLYVKYAPKLKGITKKATTSPFLINPFDHYFTFIENLIVWGSCIIGLHYFVKVLNDIKSNWQFPPETINTGSIQYNINQKIKKWRKNKRGKKNK